MSDLDTRSHLHPTYVEQPVARVLEPLFSRPEARPQVVRFQLCLRGQRSAAAVLEFFRLVSSSLRKWNSL